MYHMNCSFSSRPPMAKPQASVKVTEPGSRFTRRLRGRYQMYFASEARRFPRNFNSFAMFVGMKTGRFESHTCLIALDISEKDLMALGVRCRKVAVNNNWRRKEIVGHLTQDRRDVSDLSGGGASCGVMKIR